MNTGPNEPGSRFGPWTLIAHVGTGLIGDVWSARNASGEEIALKRLSPALREDLGARFINCARATQSLDHPLIPAISEVHEDVEGYAVVVRTLIVGESAAMFSSRRRGRVPPSEALRIVEAAARAVGHAHHQGVVHGALHAGHVLIGDAGSVSVVDFNLSELRQDAALSFELPGPPDIEQYEAPEASFGATPEADVWSLGALLFLLLTGQHARTAGSDTAASITEFAPEAPEPLINLLDCSLSPDPDARLTAEQFAGACRLLVADPIIASLPRIAAATVLNDGADNGRASAPPTSTRRASKSKIASATSGTREAAHLDDPPAASEAVVGPTDRASADLIEEWAQPPKPAPAVTDGPEIALDLSDIRDPRFQADSANSPPPDLASAVTEPARTSASPPPAPGIASPRPSEPPKRESVPAAPTSQPLAGRGSTPLKRPIVTESQPPPSRDSASPKRPIVTESRPPPARDLASLKRPIVTESRPPPARDSVPAAGTSAPAVSASEPPPVSDSVPPTRVRSSAPPLALDDDAGAQPAAPRYSSRPPPAKAPSIDLMLDIPSAPAAPQGVVGSGGEDDEASQAELERIRGILAFDSALMLEDAFADARSKPPPRIDSKFWRRLSIAPRPANISEIDESADLPRCLDVATRVVVDTVELELPIGVADGVAALLASITSSPDLLVDFVAGVDRECRDLKLSSQARVAAVRGALPPETLDFLLAPTVWGGLPPDRRGLLQELLKQLDQGYASVLARGLRESFDPELAAVLSEALERNVSGQELDLAETTLESDFQGALKLVRVLTQLSTPSAKAALEQVAARHPLPLIQVEALAGVEGLTGPRVRAELTRILETDPDEQARVQALRAIRDFELRAAGPHLALRIKSSDFTPLSYEEKRQLLHALGVIMPPRAEVIATEILLETKLLESTAHEESRVLAADLLGAIGSTEDSREALEGSAKKRWGGKESVRTAAERALSHWADRKASEEAGP